MHGSRIRLMVLIRSTDSRPLSFNCNSAAATVELSSMYSLSSALGPGTEWITELHDYRNIRASNRAEKLWIQSKRVRNRPIGESSTNRHISLMLVRWSVAVTE